jgi:hypothetical protein
MFFDMCGNFNFVLRIVVLCVVIVLCVFMQNAEYHPLCFVSVLSAVMMSVVTPSVKHQYAVLIVECHNDICRYAMSIAMLCVVMPSAECHFALLMLRVFM